MTTAEGEARRGGENADAAGGGQWSFASNALFYVMIFLVASNVLFSKPSADAPAETSQTAGAAPARTAASAEHLRPIARNREQFSMRVETDPPLFEPLRFDKLYLSHDALLAANVSVTLPVDLSSCFASNCSTSLKVIWSIRDLTFSATAPLVRFFRDNSEHKRYLFGDSSANTTASDSDTREAAPFKAYFQPEVTLSPVVFFDNPLPDAYLDFTPIVDSRPGFYGPAVYINNFWMLREHYIEINATSAAALLNFTVSVTPLPLWKMLMYTQFDKSMATQSHFGLSRQSEAEETKRMLLEVSTKNPLLLAVTAIVTALHSIFEFLAFSNDVRFWRGKKDFRGLSVRSLVINCYFQTIIFLYLLDSNSETSWAVLVPSGLGALMEYWKLAKTLHISKVEPETTSGAAHEQAGTVVAATRKKRGIVIGGYEIRFNDSYDSRTQKHDDVAVRYLIYAMIPLLGGNAIYSALYKTHRNWYSFVISTQVQFIYSFGFAQMTPQIFINYKMKSVGQLPWRTFIYKSLNTVIDDLFAFVIKMPWLHRLACFQDDVVFAILLYQRWIYPVDMSRFDGESGKDDENEEKAASQPDMNQPEAKGSMAEIGVKKNQ